MYLSSFFSPPILLVEITNERVLEKSIEKFENFGREKITIASCVSYSGKGG